MHKLLTYLFLFIAFAMGSKAFAQDVKFTAATSHTEVATGDRFQIQFTANAKITNFKAPDLSDFRVLSGPNQSTSMSFVNGAMSTSISFSYVLMAVKEGMFTIKPAIAAVDGQAYSTNSINISVSKGVNVQQQQTQQNQPEESINISKADATKDLFIKSSASKTTVYQGEHIIATYKLYTKVNIAGNELVKNADLNGFWSQEIDLGQAQWSQEVFGGFRWNVATIRKIVLFPQRSGTLTIDPLEMKFIVQRRVAGGNSVFDQFFGRVENVEANLKSEPIKIKVLPHPEPKPASFTGAVGQFEMTTNLSANKVKANEAINLKIKVSGKGNLPLIENFTIDFPKDFETYDPKVADNYKTTPNGVGGAKEYDYLIIPRHAGTFTIDPVEFSYFDPNTKAYKTIKSEPFTIEVEKGDGSAANVTFTGANKEDVQILGEDIRYIHTNDIVVTHAKSSFYGSLGFYLAIGILPLLFLLVLIFRNKLREAQRDVIGSKSRKANKMANKYLAAAKKSLDAQQHKEFYEHISKALFGYTSDKLKIPLSALSKENITEKLNGVSVSQDTISNFIATLELCEMARFAPVSVSEQEIYGKAASIINQIEKEVRL
ncbi:MAG: BatD family protein [Flavobacteriales bacterium]